MKNIGEFIKYFRLKKKLSREKLEAKTKIKKEFIEAIENLKWDELPDYPVVSGFVKNIAKALDQDERHLSALLRRDYPPKDLKVSPNQIKEKFKWSPRSTFVTGIAVVFISIFV
ncbi:MAG: helix-turn-helix domain-containing protein, partial [Patescibacteria group bacterium]|nr:helix-turn-helix domain-containing protein [Patescibacteria group bacterium]